jgi:hypothetical protein
VVFISYHLCPVIHQSKKVSIGIRIRDLPQRYESRNELRMTSLAIRQVRFGSFALFRIANYEWRRWRRWRQKATLTTVKTMNDVTLAQRNVIHDVVVIVPKNQHGGRFWFFSTPFSSPLNWHENHFDRVDCNARVFLTYSMVKICKRSNLMKLWKHSRKTFVVRIYLREMLPMLVNTKRICRWRNPRAQKVMTSHAIRIRDS